MPLNTCLGKMSLAHLLNKVISHQIGYIALLQVLYVKLACLSTSWDYFFNQHHPAPFFYFCYLDSPWVADNRCSAFPSAVFPLWHQHIASIREKPWGSESISVSAIGRNSPCVWTVWSLDLVQSPEQLSLGPGECYTCSMQQALSVHREDKTDFYAQWGLILKV